MICDKEYENSLCYKNDVCMMCEGFYGPNYGQPVCGTCHAFLYPEDINAPEDALLFAEKTESGDSGTEEPSDFADCKDEENYMVQILTPKPDKLAERITALTCPREKDNVPDGLIEALPPEVLLVVFSFLDDISLWSVSNVCKRWCQILQTHENWDNYTSNRWPLFKPFYKVNCWRMLYSNLLESATCILCLSQMSEQPLVEDSKWRNNRLKNEKKNLQTDPPEGISARPLDNSCSHWQASILGPRDSPYEGGKFYLYLQIPHSYPMRPPVVRFITKIYHPNISRHGDIGIDSIYHNWSLALTISKVLISIQSLLTDAFTHVCMEPTVGQQYRENRQEFEEIAKRWTWKYAMHDMLAPDWLYLR